ncbi:MAG: hypothetical protein AB7N65_05315 [Vicinamibacterales bacterium]
MNPLNDEEIRTLVRDAIARARGHAPTATSAAGQTAALEPAAVPLVSEPVIVHVHASQALFVLGPSGDGDGNCVIEPAVRCTHCGYCQALGH